MSNKPKFFYSKSTHLQEWVIYWGNDFYILSKVIHFDTIEQLLEAQKSILIGGSRDLYICECVDIVYKVQFTTEQQLADRLAKVMRRIADWYKFREIKETNNV